MTGTWTSKFWPYDRKVFFRNQYDYGNPALWVALVSLIGGAVFTGLGLGLWQGDPRELLPHLWPTWGLLGIGLVSLAVAVVWWRLRYRTVLTIDERGLREMSRRNSQEVVFADIASAHLQEEGWLAEFKPQTGPRLYVFLASYTKRARREILAALHAAVPWDDSRQA